MYETLSPQKAMRKSYLRVGWATVIVALLPAVISLVLSLFSEIAAVEKFMATAMENYLLLYNEALVGFAVLVGFLSLLGTRAQAPERKKISFGGFFALFAISIALTTVGNCVGQAWTLAPQVISFGSPNIITDIISTQSPWQIVLGVGILAPFIEEFFFRKLLIDRLYAHGEFLAILTSGLLFGLFHQNLGQYFYTFLFGLVIAYLYCHTGSYFLSVLMHAVFNLFNGVFPTLAIPKLTEFLTKLERVTTLDDFLTLLPKYALPVLYYGTHLLVLGVLFVLGIVLLFTNLKKIRIKPPPAALSVWDMSTNAYLNGGMLTAIVVLLDMTVLSLFL